MPDRDGRGWPDVLGSLPNRRAAATVTAWMLSTGRGVEGAPNDDLGCDDVDESQVGLTECLHCLGSCRGRLEGGSFAAFGFAAGRTCRPCRSRASARA
jgi:hypothetical protein